MVNSCGGVPLFILFFWYKPVRGILTTGFINAVGVFQTYYEQNQLSDHTPFQIGWLSSFLVFFMNLGVQNLYFKLIQGRHNWTVIRLFRSTMVIDNRNSCQYLRTYDDFVM